MFFRVISQLLVLSFLLIPSIHSETITMENDLLSLSFDSGQGFSLSELRHKTGDISLIGGSPEKPLWKIVWIDSQNIQHVLSARVQARLAHRKWHTGQETHIAFRWEDLALGEGTASVEVSVTVEPGSSLTRWDLAVDWTDSSNVPLRVDFPVLDGIANNASSEDCLVVPYYWGRMIRNPIDQLDRLELRYPSPASMQFLTYGRDAGSLYLAAYDPEIWFKIFIWESNKSLHQGSLSIENYPPFESRQHYETPYPILLGVHPGGWYDSALLYRSWATRQKWCEAGKIGEREDIPGWFKEVSLWLKYYSEPGKVLSELLGHYSYVRTPTALLHYQYPISEFDDNYPEFLPAKSGFLEFIRSAHRMGSFVMPYTNGSIWDTDTRSWEADRGVEGAVVTHAGETVEWESPRARFAYMCPSSHVWNDKVLEFVEKLVLDYDSDGVYLDMMAATAAQVCWSPSHGHPLNGGRYWGEGTRSLVKRLREAVRSAKPTAVFTTEEINEAYLDLFDGFLTLDITRGANLPPFAFLPLFSAVYHDYAIQFGSDAKLSADPDPFCGILAASYVHGVKLTLSEYDPPPIEKRSQNAEYLKELARCYHEVGEKFLRDGEWLHPLEIVTDSLRIPIEWVRKIDVPFPTIQHSLWKSSDGSLGILITNWTGQEREIAFSLDVARYGFAGDSWFLRQLWPRAQDTGRSMETRSWEYRDHLPARSVKFFEISSDRPHPVESVDYPEPPFLVIRRGKDSGFSFPSPGKDSLWTVEGEEVTLTGEGDVLIDGDPIRGDFLLLERVSTESPHEVRSLSGIRPDPTTGEYSPEELSSLSLEFRRTCQRLSREGSQPEIASAESLRHAIMKEIRLRTGIALSTLPPSHDRLVPGIPCAISCRLTPPAEGEAIVKDVNLSCVRPESLVDKVTIRSEGSQADSLPDTITRDGRIIRFHITVDDFLAIEHALTFYAEASVEWRSMTFALADELTIPCDLPLLFDMLEKSPCRGVAGAPFSMSLAIESFSDYPLSTRTKPDLPQGWSSNPTEIAKRFGPPAEIGPASESLEFTLIPSKTTFGRISIPVETVYEPLANLSIASRVECDIAPSLSPLSNSARRPTPTSADGIAIRNQGRILLFMRKGDTAGMHITSSRLASYRNPLRMTVADSEGKMIRAEEIPAGQSMEAEIVAAQTGTYSIDVDPGLNSCIVEIDHPYMVYEASSIRPLHLFKSQRAWYFYVPEGAEEFIVHVRCGGESETADMTISDPDGRVIFQEAGQVIVDGKFTVDVPSDKAARVWKMEVAPREDISLFLTGDVLPFVSDDPSRLLKRQMKQ